MKVRVGKFGELLAEQFAPGVELYVHTEIPIPNAVPEVERVRHQVDTWDAYSMQHQVFNLSGTDPEHVADLLREAADWIERQEVTPEGLYLQRGFGPDDSTELSVIYG